MTPLEILQAFRSDKCICGAKKKPQMSHCRKCYYRLPFDLRQSLYKRFGQGYEEAYQASIQHLLMEL